VTGLAVGQSVVTDAQWARSVTQRLSNLENPKTTRIGTFVLSDDGVGGLLAHSPTGTITPLTGPGAASSMTQAVTSAITAAPGGGGPISAAISALVGGTGTGGTSTTPSATEIIGTLLSFLTGGLINTGTITELETELDNIPLIGPLITELGGAGSGLSGLGTAITALPTEVIDTLLTFLSGGSVTTGSTSTLTTQLANLPLIGPLVQEITGTSGALSTLNTFFGSIESLFGNPTGLLSGSPVLPGISSIPVLGGLLSGGNLLASIIPGLNASKITSGTFSTGLIPSLPASIITSGTFAASLVQPLIDAVASGLGGSSGLSFSGLESFLGGLTFSGISYANLISLFTDAASGLTGSTGATSIFTDLTNLLGAPTNLGGGSPGLPGISSIPILGGLLSGGNILASIIPGLNASKITSGTFSASLVQPLIDAVSQGFSGSTGLSFSGLQSFLSGLSFGGISYANVISLFTDAASGLTGSTGATDIFTDLTNLLGEPGWRVAGATGYLQHSDPRRAAVRRKYPRVDHPGAERLQDHLGDVLYVADPEHHRGDVHRPAITDRWRLPGNERRVVDR
jgi:hypothetical protein